MSLCHLAAVGTACRPITQHPIEGKDVGLIVGVVLSENNSVLSVDKYDNVEQLGRFEIPENATFVTWSIPSSSLLNKNFKPLSTEEKGDLVATQNESYETVGSCGRCLTPSTDGRQRILAGDSCPIPEKSQTQVSGKRQLSEEELQNIKKSIRLTSAEDCECRVQNAGVAQPLSFSLYDSENESGAWPFRSAALSQRGDLGLFSESLAEIKPWKGKSIKLFGDELPYDGLILASIAIEDGFVILVKSGATRGEVELVYLSFSGERSRIAWSNDGQIFTFRTLTASHGRNRFLLHGNDKETEKIVIFDCFVDSENTGECQTIGRSYTNQMDDRSFTAAHLHGNDSIYFIGDQKGILKGTQTDDGWLWRREAVPDTYPFRNQFYTLHSVQMSHVNDDIWTMCGRLFKENETPLFGIFSGRLEADVLTWRLAATSRAECQVALAFKPNPQQTILQMKNLDTFIHKVDRTITRTSSTIADVEQIDRPIRHGSDYSFGWVALTGEDKSIYLRETGSSSTTIQRFGPSNYTPFDFITISRKMDDLYAFREDGKVIVVPKETREATTLSMKGLQTNERVVAARWSQYRNSFLVLTSNRERDGRLLSYSSTKLATPRILFDSLIDITNGEAITNFVDTSTIDVLFTTDKGSVFHLRETMARQVELDWTSYFNDVVTTIPDLESCQNINDKLTRGRLQALKTGIWQSMEASLGVVWISGCAGTVVRVIVTPDGVDAKIFQVGGGSVDNRLPLFERNTQRALSALNVQCSDKLIIGSQGDKQLTEHRGTIWHLTNTSKETFSGDQLFEPFETREAPEAQLLRLDAGLPVALLGPLEHFRTIYNSSNQSRTLISDLGDNLGLVLNDNVLCAAQIDSELLVAGLPNGRLLIGRTKQ
ncbi:MAG: hypothetical protein VYC39_11605 [Myxococcota bacterium]|nr:hypothetical protein [Myxococcota bacterium]